jgi:oligopeptidase B
VQAPHGEREDEFYWLRDDSRESPEVLAVLEQENAYTQACLAPLRGLEDTIFDEIVARIPKEDSSVPYRHRGWHFRIRYEEGSEYPIYERSRHASMEVPELLLDVNREAQGRDYYAVASLEMSPDGRRLAFAEDTVGRRQYVLRVRDLETGELLADEVPNIEGDVVWADDHETLLYVEKDARTLLGVRVKLHRLGTPVEADEIVYEEADASYYLGVARSKDDRYLMIQSSSTVSDEVRYAPSGSASPEFSVLLPRERHFEYDAEHLGSRWILRTNLDAENFRIVTLDDAELSRPPEDRIGALQ